MYIAGTRVKHSLTGQIYERGETVPVDHLGSDDLDYLVRTGVLREVEEQAPEPPHTFGALSMPEPPSKRARKEPSEQPSEVNDD